GGHVVHVPSAVVADDVDELVDVDLVVHRSVLEHGDQRVRCSRSTATRVGGSRRSAARRLAARGWSGSLPCSPCGPTDRTGCSSSVHHWWRASSGSARCLL